MNSSGHVRDAQRRHCARAVRGVPIVEAIVGFDDRWHLNAPAPVAEGALLLDAYTGHLAVVAASHQNEPISRLPGEDVVAIARRLGDRRLLARALATHGMALRESGADAAVDLDEASEWLPSGESSLEKQLLAREQVKQVWKAVEGLSQRQRTVFLLRYVEEQELSEIAGATGLSEGTVKAHLSRAVARVRLELGGKR